MLTAYTWPTPNGHKIHIMLEECGFKLDRDWKAVPVDMGLMASRSHCLSRAQYCFTWPPRQVNFYQKPIG
jgi:hypothetical protein